jgi:hypothetical protein
LDYQQIYNALIEKCELRGKPVGYAERHHIVPKAMGGTNAPSNLVYLLPREHYVAHRLLWRIHRNKQMARAFTLLARMSDRVGSRAYENAKAEYAQSMMGALNVAKNPEVRAKIAKNNARAHLGTKRPKQAELMRSRRVWAGPSNPHYGAGATQLGGSNHRAVAVLGQHPEHGTRAWVTVREAANELQVSSAAVSYAAKNNARCRGWALGRLK